MADEDGYECDQCGYMFDTESSLKRHQTGSDPDHDAPSDNYIRRQKNKRGDYECENCGKTFATARGRHIHQYKACQQYENLLRDWQESIDETRKQRIQALFGPNFQIEQIR